MAALASTWDYRGWQDWESYSCLWTWWLGDVMFVKYYPAEHQIGIAMSKTVLIWPAWTWRPVPRMQEPRGTDHLPGPSVSYSQTWSHAQTPCGEDLSGASEEENSKASGVGRNMTYLWERYLRIYFLISELHNRHAWLWAWPVRLLIISLERSG